jgi:hypothetical protein
MSGELSDKITKKKKKGKTVPLQVYGGRLRFPDSVTSALTGSRW